MKGNVNGSEVQDGDYCGYQQNTFTTYGDLRSAVPVSDRKDVVVCPKPRRLCGFNHVVHDPRPLRWQLSSHQAELCDSKGGSELLDLILTKGVYGAEQSSSTTQLASSPPFFNGSPPSRATNPLIQDARLVKKTIKLHNLGRRSLLSREQQTRGLQTISSLVD
ncbi:uncharacterized protein LOC122650393 [Telopea speciosissima]|uniref:uncharacterized protein LOC122650393 n=1 Tax=Telopea speciosissima TaxID=54955 RepID=UPI001CC6D14C|nr:uncharacterized protein LOC122650393 [Telopea speciosissima]